MKVVFKEIDLTLNNEELNALQDMIDRIEAYADNSLLMELQLGSGFRLLQDILKFYKEIK